MGKTNEQEKLHKNPLGKAFAIIKGTKRMEFTADEIAERVIVPKVVETDLKSIVEARLQQCGLYHRVFSRIKTPDSLVHKYQIKEYNDKKKIQDLVGIRIDLYFEDDLEICQHIMERSFDLVEWSSSESKEEEFKATKINGIFRLPEYLMAKISPATWDMAIDDTFEIQFKTMFFEGWHEIEHDMRYKQVSVWENQTAFSRYFNSILATLELCDKSIVTLFEDMGHDLYKKGKWEEMIRTHFRVKMGDQEMYPEVVELLNDDYRNNTNNLAKNIFKCPRIRLIEQLFMKGWPVPINVNTIVALLNEFRLHNDKLREIFKKRDVYNAGRVESRAETRNYDLKPLIGHRVFQSNVVLDTGKLSEEEAFKKAANYMYGWIYERYKDIAGDMPKEVATYYGERTGYTVGVIYDEKQYLMRFRTVHLDIDVGGRMWVTRARLMKEDGKLKLFAFNSYLEPDSGDYSEQELYFSYPKFYREIADNIGIFDVVKCGSSRRIVKKNQVEEVVSLILNEQHRFPVVLIISKENDEGMMDEKWLGQFRVSDFTRSVWRYCHVYTAYEDSGKEALYKLDIVEQQTPGLYVFWPKCNKQYGQNYNGIIQYDCYSASDVKECSFGRHHSKKNEYRTYDIVRGGQGFYHKLLADIRNYNVSQKFPEDREVMNEYYRSRSQVEEQSETSADWKKLFQEYSVYNNELISENQILRQKLEELQKEVYQLQPRK